MTENMGKWPSGQRKDALRNAGVGHELACAILGHELSRGIDKEYGVGFELRSMDQTLLKALPQSEGVCS